MCLLGRYIKWDPKHFHAYNVTVELIVGNLAGAILPVPKYGTSFCMPLHCIHSQCPCLLRRLSPPILVGIKYILPLALCSHIYKVYSCHTFDAFNDCSAFATTGITAATVLMVLIAFWWGHHSLNWLPRLFRAAYFLTIFHCCQLIFKVVMSYSSFVI